LTFKVLTYQLTQLTTEEGISNHTNLPYRRHQASRPSNQVIHLNNLY